jgi:poly(3-hydroxybutyrate) depolymerase
MKQPALSSGSVQILSLQADDRFAYALFRPRSATDQPAGLVVTIHDTERKFMEHLDSFKTFAEQHQHVVVAPLFPADLLGDGNEDGYKFLREQSIRYDLVLNAMVDEVAQATGCTTRFMLQGYSGGGQYAHRYMLLHPDRVVAASIAAPGEVTLPDDQARWWTGIQDVDQLFDWPVDLQALQRMAVQLVVGEKDTDTSRLTVQPPSRFWESDEVRLRSNRIERLRTLHKALNECRIPATFELMPGREHGNGQDHALELAQVFFSKINCR